jgi:hypothetical protein
VATPPDLPSNVVDLWYHYEEVAMHFNQLIIEYRLRLMGGVGAVGAVSSYLIGGTVKDPMRRNWLRALVSSGLLVLFVAAACLDLFYYNALLEGAVVDCEPCGLQGSYPDLDSVRPNFRLFGIVYHLVMGQIP